MKFLPIFTLRVMHTYYTDSRCPDFIIQPDKQTVRLVNKHRCVIKSLPDGFRMLTVVDENQKPLIALPNEVKFTFHLRLQNPDFVLFTNLSDFNDRSLPVYTNADLGAEDTRQLRLDSRIARQTERFAVVQPAAEENFVLRGRPHRGLELKDFEFEGSTKVTPKNYNSTDKILTVDSQFAPQGETFTIKYPVASQLARGVWADVEIYNNDSFFPIGEGPVEFQIAFTALHARWKYYLVSDLKGTADGFRIVNADPAPAVSAPVFNKANWRDLKQDPDPLDELAGEMAAQYPKLERHRFISDDLVPCRQAARKYLELHLDDNRLLDVLPNPSIRNYSKIEVKADADLPRQAALFHVLKYITQPFPKKGV